MTHTGPRRRWRDVNALPKPDRSPVWCRPVDAWQELLPDEALTRSDPYYRTIERRLLQDLVKYEIDDDTPIEPYLECGCGIPARDPGIPGIPRARPRRRALGSRVEPGADLLAQAALH